MFIDFFPLQNYLFIESNRIYFLFIFCKIIECLIRWYLRNYHFEIIVEINLNSNVLLIRYGVVFIPEIILKISYALRVTEKMLLNILLNVFLN